MNTTCAVDIIKTAEMKNIGKITENDFSDRDKNGLVHHKKYLYTFFVFFVW